MLKRQVDCQRTFLRLDCRDHRIMLLDGLANAMLIRSGRWAEESLAQSRMVNQHPVEAGEHIRILGHLADLFVKAVIEQR